MKLKITIGDIVFDGVFETENAPLTVAAVEKLLPYDMEDKAERDLSDVEAAVAARFASEDYEEGRRAFREKRKPQFKGR